MSAEPPYLTGLRIVPERATGQDYPFNLALVRSLELRFESIVTFFVGENGSGKSTVLEAVAALCRLPVTGGGRTELGAMPSGSHTSLLVRALRPEFRHRPKDAYFFRAEHQAHLADLLERRHDDPDFDANPYARYGGRSLHTRSHGEAFLEILTNRIRGGLLLFDEPESALSPQRQLSLLARMRSLASAGRSQFILATHSPILLTYPDATILSFDGEAVHRVELADTSHYQITKGILQNPAAYWNT